MGMRRGDAHRALQQENETRAEATRALSTGVGQKLMRVAEILADQLEATSGAAALDRKAARESVRMAKDLAQTWALLHAELRASMRDLTDEQYLARLRSLISTHTQVSVNSTQDTPVLADTTRAQLIQPGTEPSVYEQTSVAAPARGGEHNEPQAPGGACVDPPSPRSGPSCGGPHAPTNFSESRTHVLPLTTSTLNFDEE